MRKDSNRNRAVLHCEQFEKRLMLSAVAFLPNEIISNSNGAVEQPSISFVDLDGDGDADIVSAYSSRNEIVWLENDGLGNFRT